VRVRPRALTAGLGAAILALGGVLVGVASSAHDRTPAVDPARPGLDSRHAIPSGARGSERQPPQRQRLWAVLVAASHGWENYRHQADVLAQYRLLRSRGVSDKRIVLVTADDIAYDDRNPNPGTVRQRVGGKNLNRDVEVDYGPDELSAHDLTAILRGRRSQRLRRVIRSRRRDNVYVFLAGHGDKRGLYLGLDQAVPRTGDRFSLLTPRGLGAAVSRMAREQRYRRLLLAVEACNGAVFGKSVRSPGAALLSAAGPRESSLSANYDAEGGVWLADEFSFRLQREARERPAATLGATFARLTRRVPGSHPAASGDLRAARIGEFLSP